MQQETVAEPQSYTGYRVSIGPTGKDVQLRFGDKVLAHSSRTLTMHETRLPPVIYFPREDVDMSLLERTALVTNCPFKGNASYWTIRDGALRRENAVWSYEEPFDEAMAIKDYLAFEWHEQDTWTIDGELLTEKPRSELPSEKNPFIDWLVEESWKARSPHELVEHLAVNLNNEGFNLSRLLLLVRTLNPQLFAKTYTWRHGADEVVEYEASHAGLQTDAYRSSPFYRVINGEGGIRRRLEGDDLNLDFPVLQEFLEEGATDYVAVPLKFSDGQINIMSLVCDQPGGFSTQQLGQLYEILPLLSRILEAHAQRVSSLSLLQTYLGRNAGQRVLEGLVKRGDGERIHAVIWFSDLRNSTSLSDSLSRDDYLLSLNSYFDSVAGSIIDHGGEVLKFIGDAVLAIFEIEDPDATHPEASVRALAAFHEAEKRILEINQNREQEGQPPLAFGTGLHRGAITYGNIGTEKRLDFTVIGSAVNEASRIESLTKELGVPVLMSSNFAQSITESLKSVGIHELRGVPQAQEIFTLDAG